MNPPAPFPGRIYAIADVETLGVRSTPDGVVAMAEAGIETIQLRAKRVEDDRLASLCGELCARLDGWTGTLWIDDRLDLAQLYLFSGVHLGQRDLPPRVARDLLPPHRAVGWSTHTPAQVAAGEADEAVDWLAFGPVFPTASKLEPDPVVGTKGVRSARRLTVKPLVAIGGIHEENLAAVLASGADSVAVLSAICVGDPATNARRLLAAAGAAP